MKKIIFIVTLGMILNILDLNAQWVRIKSDSILRWMTVSNDTILSAAGGILHLTTNNGDGPTKIIPINGAITFNGVKISIKGNHYFFGSLLNGIFVSHDYGSTWQKGKFPNNHDPYLQPPGEFVFHGNDVYITDIKGGDIYCSTDNGDSWNSFIKNFNNTGFTLLLHIAFKDSCLYMAHQRVYKSCDNGNSWKTITSFPGYTPSLSGFRIKSMLVLDTIIFIACEEEPPALITYLFRSTDDGKSWDKITLTKGNRIWDLKACGKNLFATSDTIGVMFSTDLGNTWTHILNGLNPDSFGYMTLNDNFIFLCVQGNDYYAPVYRAPLSNCEIVITDVKEISPYEEKLSLFPNPASDILTVSFNNSHPQNKIEIMNLLGIKVMEFYSQEKTATINIESLPVGVYFLRMGNEAKMFVRN